jgi:hypothetical protein
MKKGIIKIRKTWINKPFSRIHSTKKGKKGYDRAVYKKIDKKGE